jgi:hypothetical protein
MARSIRCRRGDRMNGQCPLLAQSGHSGRTQQCPLLGFTPILMFCSEMRSVLLNKIAHREPKPNDRDGDNKQLPLASSRMERAVCERPHLVCAARTASFVREDKAGATAIGIISRFSFGARRTLECPVMAQSGHPSRAQQCPLLGVKRT